MYQSFIQLLLETGYHKYMTKLGPVYVCDEEEEKQIVYVTYHKNQQKQPVFLKNFEKEFREIKEIIFPDQPSKFLCIMIVDDGELLEEQMKTTGDFTLWVQDEQNGKLYMSSHSEQDFKRLYGTIKEKSEQAIRALEEETEEESILQSIKPFFTPVNMGIIVLNGIVFFISQFLYKGIVEAGASEWSAILLHQEWYRLLTSIFIHFDAEHLISNMLVLFLTGSFVEHYLGSVKYAAAYLACGLAGNMLSFYYEIGNTTLSLSAGASGAIYGVLGILIVILWKTKGKMEGMQGPGLIMFVMGMVLHSYESKGVDNLAHIGGLIAGIILGIFLKKKRKMTRSRE